MIKEVQQKVAQKNASIGDEALRQLTKLMQSSLSLRDRKKLFGKNQPSCFKSDDALSFFEKHLSVDMEGAEWLGKILLEKNVIEHESKAGVTALKKGEHFKFSNAYMPRLVIVGSGFSGMTLTKALASYFSIVLIDKLEKFSTKPSYPVLLENPDHFNKISVDIASSVPENVQVVKATVQSVSETGVFISEGNVPAHLIDASHTTDTLKFIPFDFVVIATGSHALGALPTNETGENSITYVDPYSPEGILESIPKIDSSENSIVLMGGGFIGIEFAGSIAHTYPQKEVVLIQRSEFIMRSTSAHNAAMGVFSKYKNLKVHVNSVIDRQKDANTLVLKTTEKEIDLKASVVFMCSGSIPNTGLLQQSFSESLEQNGLVKVNPHFQVLKANSQPYKNIFAVGDVTNLDKEKLMQNAKYHCEKFVEIAKIIVQNQNSPLPAYEAGSRVKAATLGPKKGFIIKDDKVVFTSGMINKMKGFLESSTMSAMKKQ